MQSEIMKKNNYYTDGGLVTNPGSSVNNKTGDWRTEHPVIDHNKCIRCGKCWTFCPEGCIFKVNSDDKQSFKIGINYAFCKGCGICAKECPVNAITMVKEEK